MKANRPHEHYEALLMKKVDGLLNESERLELERHLSRCDECREELEDFLDVKEATDMMTNRILADADIEPLREGPRTRAVLGVGMVLFIAGMLVMMGYGYYVFWMDPTVSIVLRSYRPTESHRSSGPLTPSGTVIRYESAKASPGLHNVVGNVPPPGYVSLCATTSYSRSSR